MQEQHQHDVTTLAAQVRGFFEQGRPFRVFHGSTNSTRLLSFKRDEMIDITHFDRVLSVDVDRQVVVAEPNVPMDKLVRETLRYGLVPPVVMEFPGITVGGGVQGGAGESSSYKWGCFNQTCNWYEMVVGNGDVVRASATENADLFYGTAGSYGTLGVLAAAEIKLVPAKKYVQLTYMPVTSFEESVKVLDEVVAKKYDYIDGIMFAPDRGVIMVGNLSDEVVGSVQRFSRAGDPWFYLHAENVSVRGGTVTESIPLVDYLFRYDRGGFWVGRLAFERFGVAFTALNRWLFDKYLHTRKLYEGLQASGASQQYIVQDLALPRDTAVQFMEFVDKELRIYPLWLCPLLPDSKSPFQSNNQATPMVVNVGVWGSRFDDYDAFVAANRLIEKKVRQLDGRKWYYAHSYYTEKEFWSMYDKAWYDKLRSRYHATNLPDIYEKVTATKRLAVNYKQGAIRAMTGRAKLEVKD